VIEGWERAKFNDPIIDALLSLRNHKDLLRKLRNGTFHYQPEIISPKMTEFLRSSDAATALLWLHFLHEEFCRWLRDCAEVMTTPEIASKWKEHCADLFGWLPPRPAEEQLTELAKRRDEIVAALDASGHDSGDAAVDLRSWLGTYDTTLKDTAERVREYRRTVLAKVGLNPDDYIR
jgi:hypothetical protein